MRGTPFPGENSTTSLLITELGFGCSAVGGRTSRKDSLLALEAAFDAGITLYDTARSYGYGESERVVGEFLRGRRDKVVVCTKFGIMPATVSGWKRRVKPLAQAAVRAFPGLRAMAQRQARDQFAPDQFSMETLRTSLETSLRELRTDYVDMLLLHAAPASVLRQHDLLEAMERLVESGKVRVAGISGKSEVIAQFFAERPRPLTTAQFALNLANLGFAADARSNDDLLLVGNHVYGGPGGAAAGKELIQTLRAAPQLPAALREKLDPNDTQTLPEVTLHCVLRGTGLTAVVAAMMQLRHIKSNVRALNQCRFTGEEIARMQDYFNGISRPDGPPIASSVRSA